MEPSLSAQFQDILESEDVDALKASLQNLMVLFETQNRNYLELKQQVKNLKLRKSNMQLEQCDSVTILPEENRPPSGEIVEETYELLAGIRKARKVHNKTATSIEKMLSNLASNEEQRAAQMDAILNQNVQ